MLEKIIFVVFLMVFLVDGQDSGHRYMVRPGKRGPEGPRGPVGPMGMKGTKGDPGQCSDRLSKVERELNELKGKFSRFSRCPQLKFTFPAYGQTSRWIKPIHPIPYIRQITICAWITPHSNRQMSGALVSYATSNDPNDLLLFFGGNIQIWLDGDEMHFDVNIRSRTHVCVMVNAVEGEVKYYQNGYYQGTRTTAWYHSGTITSGGSFLIGQEQDSVGGGFDGGQALKATVENFYLWYRELDSGDIRSVYNLGCSCPSITPDLDLRREKVQIKGSLTRENVQKCI